VVHRHWVTAIGSSPLGHRRWVIAVGRLPGLQESIEAKLEKRTKGVFAPVGGKRLVAFIDDLNMPAKSKFGFIPPLELIKLWADNGFWCVGCVWGLGGVGCWVCVCGGGGGSTSDVGGWV
jgi:hypothetical protein